MKLRSLASSTVALQLLPALLATVYIEFGITLMTLAAIVAYKGGGSMVRLTCLDFGLTLGLAAIYSSSLGHAHMVILTFFGHFICSWLVWQSGFCVILCFSLLSSRMVVCEVLIELHHGNHQMNSIVISL